MIDLMGSVAVVLRFRQSHPWTGLGDAPAPVKQALDQLAARVAQPSMTLPEAEERAFDLLTAMAGRAMEVASGATDTQDLPMVAAMIESLDAESAQLVATTLVSVASLLLVANAAHTGNDPVDVIASMRVALA